MKKLASALIRQAKSLSNMDNTNSFSFSEMFDYVNAAYREIYTSMIEIGDFSYLKEVNVSGAAEFELPEDFFQLAFLRTNGCYGYNSDLERDYDYQLRNGCIKLNGITGVTMGYYPVPELITFKPEKKEVDLPLVPTSAWDTLLIDANSNIYDFRDESWIREDQTAIGSYILGANTFLNITPDAEEKRNAYDFEGNLDAQYTTPVLRSDGTFNEDIYSTGHAFGWANEDGSIEYTVNEGNLYYTDEYGTVLIAENYTPGLNAKILFLNGDFVLVDLNRINYKDGSWETTDVPKAVVICKASLETGYGYLAKDGLKWFLTGFLPETKIDFPNNIFFDMMAYDIAIQMRRKVNEDTSDLQAGYDDRKGQYVMTLTSDGANFPTIRNVRSPFGHFAY